MSDRTSEVTYSCPIPGCGWSMTEDRRPTLSAAVFRRLARDQGMEQALEAEFESEHANLLFEAFAGHLRSHGLRPEQVRFLAGRMVRAAITK